MLLRKQLNHIYKLKQSTDTVLMVRPVAFAKNEQTASSNYFQKNVLASSELIQQKALTEFDEFVKKLEAEGVKVLVIEDTKEPHTPDSIFPNNWISFHGNGVAAVYPMEAENRRLERREDVLDLVEANGFVIDDVVDYTQAEEEGIYLEGTGSIILDRVHKKAYCALSSRADEDLFIEFCEDFEYDPVTFIANQTVEGKRKPIYHTNVMMTIATDYAVICLDSIDDKKEKKNVVNHLKATKKEIIAITEEQMHFFAGNMLQLSVENKNLLVLSQQAYDILNEDQIVKIKKYAYLLPVNLKTIETLGGGSARCMLAEVF